MFKNFMKGFGFNFGSVVGMCAGFAAVAAVCDWYLKRNADQTEEATETDYEVENENQ